MNNENELHQDLINRRIKQAVVLFAITAGFFVVAEHRAHVVPYLPWLLLLACPLMHLFMHRGHGRHQHDGRPKDPNQDMSGRAGGADVKPSLSAGLSQHTHGVRS